MQQELRRRVIELIGRHRVDDADLIFNRAEVWQEIARPKTGTPRARELVLRCEQRGMAFDEGEFLALEILIWTWRAVELREFRLVIKQLELAWRTREMDVNHILRARGKVRRPRREWVFRSACLTRTSRGARFARERLAQQLTERNSAETEPRRAAREISEECASRRLRHFRRRARSVVVGFARFDDAMLRLANFRVRELCVRRCHARQFLSVERHERVRKSSALRIALAAATSAASRAMFVEPSAARPASVRASSACSA